MSAVFSNIDAEHTSKFDSNAKVEYFYDSTKYFEGEIDTVEYSPHKINITASSYGAQLQRLDASPQSYHVEPGRTITIADVLSGFPYQHGGVKEFDVDPDESIWDTDETTDLRRVTEEFHTQDYAWRVLMGDISRKIYVNPDVYDKIKVSCWEYANSGTSELKCKSSSDATYTTDTTTTTDTWERLEVTEDLESGDNYFDIVMGTEKQFEDVVVGSLNSSDYSATTDGMEIEFNSFGKSSINVTGYTYLYMTSENEVNLDAPTDSEYFKFKTAYTGNTTSRPKLYIEYTSVGSGDGNTTIYPTAGSGGYMSSGSSASYEDAWKGLSPILRKDDLSSSLYTSYYLGQDLDSGTYRIYKTYIAFDTSSLPDDAVITTATLKMTGAADSSTTDFNVWVFIWDSDGSITTADWTYDYNSVYFDDFTYCLHYKDDDASVWDNGVLCRTQLTDTNVSCDIAIDSFEVGQSEKKQSVIERLMEQSEGYEWKVDPANKDFYFREFPVTANTTEIAVGANTTDIRPQRDFTELWNDVYVNGHPPGEDWQSIWELETTTYGFATIAVLDEDHIIIGTYASTAPGDLRISSDGGETFAVDKTLASNGDYAINTTVDFENEIAYAMTTGTNGIQKLVKGSGTWSEASWADENTDLKYGSEVVKLTDASGDDYYFVGAWSITDDKRRVYRKKGTGGTWTNIYESSNDEPIYAIAGANDTLCAALGSVAATTGGVYRCTDPFDASPTFTKVYDFDAFTSGRMGQSYGGISKYNYQTDSYDFYFGVHNSSEVPLVIKSSNDGLTWAVNETFSESYDYSIQHMRENDGVVYAVIRGNGTDTYGRIVKTVDEGANWITDVLGDSTAEYYAIDTYGAKVYSSVVNDDYDKIEMQRKQDNYTVSAHYEDATSITAYGRRTKILDTNQVYSYDEALRFAQTICNTYKDPKITIYADLVFSPDLEVSKTIRYVQAVPTTRCHSPVKTGDDAGLLGSYNLYEASHYVPEMRTSVTANNNRESVSTLISKLVKKKVSDIKQIGEGIVTAYDSDSKTASVYSPQTFTTIFGIRVIPTSVSEGDRVLIGYPSSQTGTPIIVGVIQTI